MTIPPDILEVAQKELRGAAGELPGEYDIDLPANSRSHGILEEGSRTGEEFYIVQYRPPEDAIHINDVAVKLLGYGRALEDDPVGRRIRKKQDHFGERPATAWDEDYESADDLLSRVLADEYGDPGTAEFIEELEEGAAPRLNAAAVRLDVAKELSDRETRESMEDRYRRELMDRAGQGLLQRWQYQNDVPADIGRRVAALWPAAHRGELSRAKVVRPRSAREEGWPPTTRETIRAKLRQLSSADGIRALIDSYLDSAERDWYNDSRKQGAFLLDHQRAHTGEGRQSQGFPELPFDPDDAMGTGVELFLPDGDPPYRYAPPVGTPPVFPDTSDEDSSSTGSKRTYTGRSGTTGSGAPRGRSTSRSPVGSADTRRTEEDTSTDAAIDPPDAGPMIDPDAVYADAVDTVNTVLGRGTIRRPPSLSYHLLLDEEIERMYQEEGRIIFAEYFPDSDRIDVYAPPLKVETYTTMIEADPDIGRAHEAFEAGELFDAPRDEAAPVLQGSLLQDVYGIASSPDEVDAFFDEMYEEDPDAIGLNPTAVGMDMMRLGLDPDARRRLDATYQDRTQYTMEHEVLHKDQIARRIPMDVGEAVAHAWDLSRLGALGTTEGDEVLLANLSAPSYEEYAPNAPERGKELLERVPRSGEEGQLRELARYQDEFAGEGSGRKRPGVGAPSPTGIVGDLLDPGGIDALGGASTGSPVADFILDAVLE